MYCEPLFFKKDGDRKTYDERECISGMSLFSVNGSFCRSVGYTKYGPFRNRVTNRVVYTDIDQSTKKCVFDNIGFNDELGCWNMVQNLSLYVGKSGMD